MAAIVLQLLRSTPHGVSGMFQPFWSITYAHGYVRRGLLGTVFQFFVSGYSPQEQLFPILAVHVLTFSALIAAVFREAIVLARNALPSRRSFLAVGVAAFFLSKFAITVSYCTGYTDVILLLLAFVAGRLLDRGRVRAALVVAMIAPFLHEAFVFLWAPSALLFLLRGPQARSAYLRRAALVALPVVAAVVAVALHSDAALHATLDPLPFPQVDKDGIYHLAYGLTLREAVDASTRGPREFPGNAALGFAWFSIYSAIMIACAVRLDSRRLRHALPIAIAATFGPCAILLVAWDFSRFLVWSQLGGLFVLLSNAGVNGAAEAKEEPGGEREKTGGFLLSALRGAVVVLALLSTGPHIYLYYDHAFAEWPFGPEILRRSPAASLSYAFIDYYNRRQTSAFALSTRCADIDIDPQSHKVEGKPCHVELGANGWMNTPSLFLSPGRYDVAVSTSSQCAGTHAGFSLATNWRFGRELLSTPIDPNATTKTGFVLSAEDAAMGAVRMNVAAFGTGSCLRVEEITLERAR